MKVPPTILERVAHTNAASYPFKEDYLQWLLDTTPELLPVRDFLPTVASVASLGREIPVHVGNKSGYIDNLFVTNDARLVLVETKLYRNPEGVREVVAQTYQYGEALNHMTYLHFEDALRKGMRGGNELGSTETVATRIRTLLASGHMIAPVDDFEYRLASNIRRGEMLYLIVADGIHVSVERMTHWLNEIAGSAPHRFGLIELRSYLTGLGSAIVVPRALLRTKEISRHVVVIESRVPDATVSATVEDRTGTESGAVAIKSRTVTAPLPVSLGRDALLDDIRSRSAAGHDVARALMAALEVAAFDTRATATEFQFGFMYPSAEGEMIPLISLTSTGVYVYFRTRVMSTLGNEQCARFRQAFADVAPFFTPTEVSNPKKQWGHAQRYEVLEGKVNDLVRVLTALRTATIDALMRQVES